MTTIIANILQDLIPYASTLFCFALPAVVISCGGGKEDKSHVSKAAPVDKDSLPQLPPPPPDKKSKDATKSKSQSIAAPTNDGAKSEVKNEGSKAAEVEEGKKDDEEKKEENKDEKKEASQKKDPSQKKAQSQKIMPYPSVKGPTKSKKQKKEEQVEKEKKEKIADGFFQSKSDEDDTLEKVKSLEAEMSMKSKKNGVSSKKHKKT